MSKGMQGLELWNCKDGGWSQAKLLSYSSCQSQVGTHLRTLPGISQDPAMWLSAHFIPPAERGARSGGLAAAGQNIFTVRANAENKLSLHSWSSCSSRQWEHLEPSTLENSYRSACSCWSTWSTSGLPTQKASSGGTVGKGRRTRITLNIWLLPQSEPWLPLNPTQGFFF